MTLIHRIIMIYLSFVRHSSNCLWPHLLMRIILINIPSKASEEC